MTLSSTKILRVYTGVKWVIIGVISAITVINASTAKQTLPVAGFQAGRC